MCSRRGARTSSRHEDEDDVEDDQDDQDVDDDDVDDPSSADAAIEPVPARGAASPHGFGGTFIA